LLSPHRAGNEKGGVWGPCFFPVDKKGVDRSKTPAGARFFLFRLGNPPLVGCSGLARVWAARMVKSGDPRGARMLLGVAGGRGAPREIKGARPVFMKKLRGCFPGGWGVKGGGGPLPVEWIKCWVLTVLYTGGAQSRGVSEPPSYPAPGGGAHHGFSSFV